MLAALGLGIALQPKQPKFAGDRGYQEEAASYRAGGSSCEPSNISSLPIRLRQSKSDACAESEEQHREAADNLIENRRAAVAAEASAAYAAAQARIEAWGAAIGLLTLFAALAAALFAERAAFHTKGGALTAKDSLAAQQRVAAAELRPWIKAEVFVLKFGGNDGCFRITFEIVFTNIGQTVAEGFAFEQSSKFCRLDSELVKRQFKEWEEPKEPERLVLMPGESRRGGAVQMQTKDRLPWHTSSTRNSISFVVITTAFYRSAVDDKWHRTDRSFLIGEKGEQPFNSGFYLYEDMVGDDLLDSIVVRSFISGETT